jgi:hypothetical protein
MNKIKKYILLIVASLAIILPATPVVAQGVLDDTCKSNPEATLCQENSNTKNKNTIYGPDGIITKVVKLLSFVIGFAAILMIMIGGFKYVVSNGDSSSVNSAKNTILYAIIGLVIASLAQAIIVFVINKL